MADETVGKVQVIVEFTPDQTQLNTAAGAAAAAFNKQFNAAINQGRGAQSAAAGAANTAAAAFRNFTPAVQAANAATKVTVNVANQARDSFNDLGVSVAAATFILNRFITVPVLNFFREAVNQANNVTESINAVQQAFQESGGEVIAFARNLSDNFGLADAAILQSAANIGLLFQEIGFASDTLAGLSEQLIIAAGDIGSLFNVNTNKVIQDFTSGIQGQTRVVRKYGIDISIATLQQKAFEFGITETNRELTEQEKRLTRTRVILEQSTVAIGDAAATSDTFAGVLRVFRANMADVGETVGNIVIPTLKIFFDIVNSIIGAFQRLPGFLQGAIVAFAALAAVAGPLALTFNLLSKASTTLGFSLLNPIASIQKLIQSFRNLNLAARGGVIGLGLLAAALTVKLISDATNETARLKRQIQELGEASKITSETVKEVFGVDTLKIGTKDLEAATKAFDDLRKVTQETAIVSADIFDQQTKIAAAAKTISEIQRARAILEKAVTQAVKDGFLAQAESLAQSVDDIKFRNELIALLGKEIDTIRERNKEQEEFTRRNKELFDTGIVTKNLSDLAIAGQKFDRTLINISKTGTGIISFLKAFQEQSEITTEVFSQAVQNTIKSLNAFDPLIKAQETLNAATENSANIQDKINKLLKEGRVDLEKVADAEESLTRAREKAIEAAFEREEAEKALQEALKPASTDDLSEAEDRLTLARIALREATEAAKEAEDELSDASGQTLNLAGKSLAQIKEILANARTSAAARSKAAKDSVKETKTAQQLADEALKQQIAIRDAAREVRDVEKELEDIRAKGSELDPDVIQARKDLAKARSEEASATKETVKAQKELNIVKAGDLEFEDKLAALRVDKAQADKDAKTAQIELNTLVAAQLNDQEKLFKLKLHQIDAGRVLLAQEKEVSANILRPLVESLIGGLVAGPVGPAGISPSKSLIDRIVEALINNPNSPFAEIFRQFGIPGFHAQGGVFTKPTLGIFGEAGREGLIPMTKPFRAAQILGKDPAWPAIAKHLQAMSPVALSKPLDSVPGIRVPARLGGGGGVGAGGKEMQEMLKLLRQIAANQQGVTLNVEQKIEAKGLDEAVIARRAAQALKREFLRSI